MQVPKTACKISVNRPASTSLFTGRVQSLKTLEKFFNARGAGRQTRREFPPYGIGGAGKIQLALRFVKEFSSR